MNIIARRKNQPNNSRFGSARLLLTRSLMVGVVVSLGCLAQPTKAQEGQQGGGAFQSAARSIRNGLMRWSVPNSRLTDGPNVRKAFREVVEEARKSTVRVKVDGKDSALGGIVGPDGWILTKASRLKEGKVTCKLQDGRELDAQVIGVQQPFDLAMLKVDAQGLPSLEWSKSPKLMPGQWIATSGLGEDPIGIGVVGTGSRKIGKQAGILGITRAPDGNSTRIDRVAPGSGADKAGVQVNDQVTHVNGVAVKTWEELVAQIRKFGPGESVDLTIKRGKKTINAQPVLSSLVQGMQPSRRHKQNNMGGPLSVRRHGFPTAFQHDIVLRPADCGGPLVDLEGRVLGFNIARGGRTESYAIPSSTLMTLMYPLMSGQLLPEEAQLVSAESNDDKTGKHVKEKKESTEDKNKKAEKKPVEKSSKKPAKNPAKKTVKKKPNDKKSDDKKSVEPKEKLTPAPKKETEGKRPVKKDKRVEKSSSSAPLKNQSKLPSAPEPSGS